MPLIRAAAAGLGAALLLAPAAARAEASPRAVDALIHDLEKIVENETSLGWKIDKYDIEKMMPDALLSVCRTTDEARLAALGSLDERIGALGGPIEEAYRANGKSFDGLKELLFVSRIRALLEEASSRARRECSLGIEPDQEFKGLQTDAYRFTLSAEGGGLFTLQRQQGSSYQVGGGGSGRLLLGRGLNQTWTLMAGLEGGTTAIVDQSDTATNFPLQFTCAVPLVVRRHWVSWHFDFETAPLAFFTTRDTSISPGARLGFLVGVSTLRLHNIMPWAGIGIATEYIFKTQARPPIALVKGGLRVGFDWDF